MKRSIQYSENPKLPPDTKKELDKIINEYPDIFSKNQYDIGTSTPPLPHGNTHRGTAIHIYPLQTSLKFRSWADNTIKKLLEAIMIQRMMSTWASPGIIIPKKGLETNLEDPKKPFPVDAKLCLCCDYRKLKQKIVKQGVNAPYPLPCIDKMLATIWGKHFLTTLDCTGAFQGSNYLQMLQRKVHL